jgi:molybdopterin synthase sulfur carrier subunit
MKNIQILFFGKLKESWNSSKKSMQTQAKNLEELYAELVSIAKEIPHKPSIKVAINEEFTDWDSEINDGDVIAFLPPASGG